MLGAKTRPSWVSGAADEQGIVHPAPLPMDDAPPLPLPLAAAPADYWSESYRPLTSLVFVAPLLAAYELGVFWLGSQAIRNGADVWLRQLLDQLGFSQHFLLPALVLAVLLGWHYTRRESWRLSPAALGGMALECFVLAFALRAVLQAEGMLVESLSGRIEPGRGAWLALSPDVRASLGYLGAGVYEELLFRLMLLPAVAWTLRRLDLSAAASLVTAALSTSFVFAAAHYVGPHGEACQWGEILFWFGFSFRLLAGIFFAWLFLYRGFGIAAGAHAGYDILVGIV